MWMANMDRLPTKARLSTWGTISDSTCSLCEIFNETRDHLFLRCPYSYGVWRLCFQRLRCPFMRFNTWDIFMRWLRSSSSSTPALSLRLIMTQAMIYCLWRERNRRILNGSHVQQRLFSSRLSGLLRTHDWLDKVTNGLKIPYSFGSKDSKLMLSQGYFPGKTTMWVDECLSAPIFSLL